MNLQTTRPFTLMLYHLSLVEDRTTSDYGIVMSFGFREVVIDQHFVGKWTDIDLNLGKFSFLVIPSRTTSHCYSNNFYIAG